MSNYPSFCNPRFVLYLTFINIAVADNVLLIIADDLGRDSLGIYNDEASASVPPTPTIDSLAASGIQFNRAYAYPTCSPTRSSILTGRHHFRTGVHSPSINELQPNEFTLAEAILESGQIGNRLAHFGKWHLGGGNDGPNVNGGWPHYAGSTSGGVSDYYSWTKVVNGVSTRNYSVYATTDVVNDAIAWIDEQGEADWFAWVAFNAPHTPFHKPDNSLHDYDHLDGSDSDISNNSRPYYEAMIQAMDTEIGRLLAHVDLAETTVIFMGDNGTPGRVAQAPFGRGHTKGSLYEGGVNVPFIVAGAGVDSGLAGIVSEELVHSVDLYLTILDLLGIDLSGLLPNGLVYDSLSFFPYLNGSADAHVRDYTYSGSYDSGEGERNLMLVNDAYKWIQFADGTEELYALSDGLSETNNRINGLDSEEMASLAKFEIERDVLVNLPQIVGTFLSQDGAFTIETGWFADANLSVEHCSDLLTGDWSLVDSVSVIDIGEATVELVFDIDSESQQFFRVGHTP
ncbi:MAG: sulfatase-like hydrolase/transferase [Opitutales bacterium]